MQSRALRDERRLRIRNFNYLSLARAIAGDRGSQVVLRFRYAFARQCDPSQCVRDLGTRGIELLRESASCNGAFIFGDLNTTVQFATAFASETESQTERMRAVVRRMEEVAAIADGAASGARQTSAATAHQFASLGELTATSQHLSEAAPQLAQTIRRFRVNGSALLDN